MTSIPLTWLISAFAILIAALTLRQGRLPLSARIFFTSALAAIAIVTGLVGFRLESGVSKITMLQPHLAILIAPAFLLGFRSLTYPSAWPPRTCLATHAAIITFAQVAIVLPLRLSADIVVTALNSIYLICLAALLRLNNDDFIHIASQSFGSLRIGLVGSIAFLLLINLADMAIVFVMLSSGATSAIQFLTGVSGIIVVTVLLGALVGIPMAFGQRSLSPNNARHERKARDEDHDIVNRVDDFMKGSQLYKDPGLTLARLAKRVNLPAKTVSTAVNRVTGENVSRYINGFRIRHGGDLLVTSDLPVTEIMLETGFVSKSTFNTEFRRITGQTPSEFRKSERPPEI